MRQRSKALCSIGVLACLITVGSTCAAAEQTPTIAEMLASPQDFAGERVAVYGIVVSVAGGLRVFLLQDVSQESVRVVRPTDASVRVGDQVLVRGFFRLEGAERYISADEIESVQVTGGG